MNPLAVHDAVQDGCLIYVESSQLIASPDVQLILDEPIMNELRDGEMGGGVIYHDAL